VLGESTDHVDEPPLGPAPERSYASVADRLVALLLDAVAWTILAFLATVVVALVLGPPVTFHDGAGSIGEAVEVDRGLAAVNALVVGALGAAYFIGSWSRGGTLGQRLLGLSVARDADGSAPPPASATVRWLALVAPFSLVALLDAGLSGVGTPLWIVAAIWYLLLLASTVRAPAGRGWHDRLAGTVLTRPVQLVRWGASPQPQERR
jgi:uncharacterized RDD family membrane protein YckC